MNQTQRFVTPFSLAGSVSDTEDFVTRTKFDDSASRLTPGGDDDALQPESLAGSALSTSFAMSDTPEHRK